MLLLCLLLENVHLKWLLKFVKGFLCVYLDYHMEIIFQLVNMVYHINWFPYIEEFLHPWDKTVLIMICNSFYVVLDSDFQTFVGDLCIYVHQWYCSVIFYSCGIFGFDISVMVASWNGLGRFPSSAMFLKSLSMKPVRSFGRICLKPSGPGLLFFERLFVIVSISCLWLVCSYFLFLPGSVFEGYTFLRICPFLPLCLFY